MNSQNGISSVAVWFCRLLPMVTMAATNSTLNITIPASSMPSCRNHRGRGGSSTWNSSIRICPPCSVTYAAAMNVRLIRK